MAFFNEFPRSRTYDSDLGWLLHDQKEINDRLDGYTDPAFMEPVFWDITKQYPYNAIVRDGEDGHFYMSKKPVPAGIQLTNTEYWQDMGFYTGAPASSDLIINVADYGALGVEDADYTQQIQAAIDAGNYIYFPAGSYSFGTIAVNKPLHIFGEGEKTIWKPLNKSALNNTYKPMLIAYSDIVFDNIKFTGSNPVTTETGEMLVTESILKCYGANAAFKNCTITDMFHGYRASVVAIPWNEREGIFFYASDCKQVLFDSCVFGQYGGNELIWISRPRAKFAEGETIIINCSFNGRTQPQNANYTGGSVFNTLGGYVEFANNHGKNSFYSGSFVNLFGNVVNVHDNVFTDFLSDGTGSMIDTCESYYIKNKAVFITDNIIEEANNVTTVHVNSYNTYIADNVIKGLNTIKTRTLTDYATSETWHDPDIEAAEYNDLIIYQNTCIVNAEGTSYAYNNINIGHPRESVGSRAHYRHAIIKNNILKFADGLTTRFALLIFMSSAQLLEISNNYFDQAATPQTGSYPAFIGIQDTYAADNVIAAYNIFNKATERTNVFAVTASYLPNLVNMIAGNSGGDPTNIYIGGSTGNWNLLSNNANINV